jgi:hypothetical protein
MALVSFSQLHKQPSGNPAGGSTSRLGVAIAADEIRPGDRSARRSAAIRKVAFRVLLGLLGVDSDVERPLIAGDRIQEPFLKPNSQRHPLTVASLSHDE